MADNSGALRLFWPDIDDATSAKAASRIAVWTCAIWCVWNAAVVTYARVQGDPNTLRLGAFAYLDFLVFAVLGALIWRMWRTAAVLAFAIYLIEQIVSFMNTGIAPVSIVSVALLLFYVSGMRGTFLFHRFGTVAHESNDVAP
jgi:hypothetical protein